MTSHATAELLSACIDDSLSRLQEERLEEHLDDCDRCGMELAGLRRVVERLNRVERQLPPATLGYEVRRRVASEHASGRLSERLMARRSQVRPQLGMLAFLGPLLGLAAILFVFLQQVERQQSWQDVIVIRHPARQDGMADLPAPLAEPGLLSVSEQAPPAEVPSRRVGDLVFDFADGVWIQRGVDARQAVRVLEVDARKPPAVRIDVAALASLGGPVVADLDGEVVELRFGAGAEAQR